jgi:hypothetical protein
MDLEKGLILHLSPDPSAIRILQESEGLRPVHLHSFAWAKRLVLATLPRPSMFLSAKL